jgi:hypothetical protein
MTIQIVKTKSRNGDFIKVKVDNVYQEIFPIDERLEGSHEDQVMKRAEEIAQWIWENGGLEKVIKEFTCETV